MFYKSFELFRAGSVVKTFVLDVLIIMIIPITKGITKLSGTGACRPRVGCWLS